MPSCVIPNSWDPFPKWYETRSEHLLGQSRHASYQLWLDEQIEPLCNLLQKKRGCGSDVG